ncbi:MAG: MFS transporter [Alphaproteobacteria bacterium]|nr:MFS transporter [Alphaproteobacteria bacterium]
MPSWIRDLGRPGPAAFLALFLLETSARTLLLAVVPLQALAILGDARKVSLLYFGVSLAGLAASLGIPWLTRRLRRRGVFTLGGGAIIAACLLLAGENLPGLWIGLWLQILGTACLEVTLNLYVLDYVRRKELGRFEPKRIFIAAVAWTVCPGLGVLMRVHGAAWLPYAATAAVAVLTLLYFRWVRGSDEPPRPVVVPANPLRYLPRFFAQPRLRLAWTLAMGRAGWWVLFFVYAPIYAVSSGLGEAAGGAIVSAGGAFLFTTLLWGWVARRFGMRRLLAWGYALSGALTVVVAILAQNDAPLLGAAVLVGAAAAASMIDGVGNAPFLRAVHPLERAEMTTVFNTFRHTAQILAPGLFALLLEYYRLPAVFLAGGIVMAAMAALSFYIPRRM